ncbi:MAG: hypothetical protein WCS65_16440 [Verrucomicrobiae bacterium]
MAALRSLGLAVKQLRSRYRYTATTEQMIRSYVGGYAALLAMAPTIGEAGTDDRVVVSWDLTEGESVNGKLEITEEKAKPDMGGSGIGGGEALGDPIYELDWAEERRPIEQHKKMPRLAADRPWYAKPWCSASDVDNKHWSGTGTPPSSLNGYQQREWSHWTALDANDIVGGTWSLAEYKSLVEKGITDLRCRRFLLPHRSARGARSFPAASGSRE